MTRRKRIVRWPAIVSAAVSVVGLLSHPETLNLLARIVAPATAETVSLAVSVAGIFLQAVTKPVARQEHERRPAS